MKKIKTGVIIKEGFNRSKTCVGCGIFGTTKCDSCKDIKRCKICSRLLRQSWFSYFYEPKKGFTGHFIESKIKCYSYHQPFSDNMCEGCVDWEDYIKDECFICGNKFKNTPKHFLLFGNTCIKDSADTPIDPYKKLTSRIGDDETELKYIGPTEKQKELTELDSKIPDFDKLSTDNTCY